jgi:septal ring factor EnvC (AmiA/AmiB activator)
MHWSARLDGFRTKPFEWACRISLQMPKRSTRQLVPPIVAAVVQPVAKRLSRIEALLIEMRHEQDVQLKRGAALQRQLETLAERVAAVSQKIRRSRANTP